MPNPLVRALIDEMTDDDLRELATMLSPHLDRGLGGGADDLLTAREAAQYLRCNRQRIYDLRHSGDLTPMRDGTRLLFRRHELNRYLEERAGR